MMTKLYVKTIGTIALTIFCIGCTHQQSTQSNNKSKTSISEIPSENNKLHQQASSQICPIPPPGHEKIPGYKVGRVDPSLNQKNIEIISPATMALGRGLISDIFTTVEFCGTAKDDLAKVKLFASNAGIKENQISADSVNNIIGETSVIDGLWFISYKFTTKGNRAILVRGYDKDGKLVATSSPVALLQIYSPNP